MGSTIENTNTNILKKTDIIIELINLYQQYDLNDVDLNCLEVLQEKTIELKSAYELGSINILTRYYQNKDNRHEKEKIYNEYMKFIVTENFVDTIKWIFNKCNKTYRVYKITDVDITTLIKEYEFLIIEVSFIEESSLICPCGTKFIIEPANSELVCPKCGISDILYGSVFEDEQFFYQEGNRTKHGKYDPTKHCRFWMDRILAKEHTEIPIKIISLIKQCIKRDNIYLDNLTCPVIRSYLKEKKKTAFNDHVPLIRKLITGREPKQLTDHELKLVYRYFSHVIRIYNKIKVAKNNSPYHPYFIYKILEQMLKDKKDYVRKVDILSCIHLQSRETLIDNDNTWQKICKEIPEFTYQPTMAN